MDHSAKRPRLMNCIYVGIFCLLAVPKVSLAAACRPVMLLGQEGRAVLARSNYSPFPVMSLTSFLGNLSATLAIAKGFDGAKDFKLESGIAITFWSASGLLAFSETCKPQVDSSIDPGSVRPDEIDLDRFATDRRMFLLAHTFNTIPTLAFAIKSDHEQRWLFFSGALLLPAIADVLLRTTFSRERVSPWTFSPTSDEQAGVHSLGISIGYHW